MKEQIYTIPVNDGFDADSECPFCTMRETLEKNALSYTLGPSYMEQDVRDMTNASGFCREHYRKMYESRNRLGLALMVSTHMAAVRREDCEAAAAPKKKRGLRRGNDGENRLSELVSRLEKSCFVCDKINTSMDRYFDTFFYLWKREAEFREKVLRSKGFCLAHFERLLTLSEKKLSGAAREEFANAITELWSSQSERVEKELLWFISKFDQRFHNEPWGNSRDSLRRAIIKTAAYDPEEGTEGNTL